MTHVKLTRKGVVRLTLLLHDVFEAGDEDGLEWWERYEEAIRVIDLVLRNVDGVVEAWEPAAPDGLPRARVPAAG